MVTARKQYVVGKDQIPVWLDRQASEGRVRLNREESELVSVTVYTPTGVLTAHLGDVIILSKTGLVVLSAEQARKYGILREQPVKTNGKE